jgi:hypothetical protein
MVLSVERGRWLVLAGIVVYPLLDIAGFVLGWTLLGRIELMDHAIRIAATGAVGFFLYHGHVWARWFVILTSAAAVVAGVVHIGSPIDVRNPFSVLALLVVLVAAAVGILLTLSTDVKAFLASQRNRRRTSS